MEYIVFRRFRGKSLSGKVNLPYGTKCQMEDGIITFQGSPICCVTSEVAHQYFSRNDDGNGIRRGQLAHNIQQRLAKRDGNYQKRWDKIWGAPALLRYKRIEHEDHWLWNNAFFNAPIDDLIYIASLIGAEVD